MYTSKLASKSGSLDITTKLYIPSSRVFCISQAIPFHLTFESSVSALAAFRPLTPAPGQTRPTRLEVMRQSTLDVRLNRNGGGQTSIWRVDCIGSGSFTHAVRGCMVLALLLLSNACMTARRTYMGFILWRDQHRRVCQGWWVQGIWPKGRGQWLFFYCTIIVLFSCLGLRTLYF